MKLPFTIKLGAVKGAFARLKPTGLLGKIKSKLPFKAGDKKKAKFEDEDDSGDDDLFGDLGDLDELDAEATARQRGEGGADEEDVDYTSDAYTTDKEVDLDDMSSAGGQMEREGSEFADLDAEDEHEGVGEGIDLSTLHAMPDFEDDHEDHDEDEAADDKAKKKKLLLIAGGGVAAAILIGAASWLVLSDSPPPEDNNKPVDLAATHDAVISLDNVPLASQGLGATKNSSLDSSAGALTPPSGSMPVQDGGDASAPMSAQESELAQLGLIVAQEPGVGVVVPSVTRTSFDGVPPASEGTPLAVAPNQTLVDQTDLGILPKIAEDGLTAYDAYARPEPEMDPAKPKIAIIVKGVGLSRAATEAAISAMPQDVALSLDIYARGLDFWVARARQDGHEVLLSLPLEAENFPFSDPGPDALKVLNASDVNVQKLDFILSRTAGYFGVLAEQGGKFLTVQDQVDLILGQLKDRGLMYVDSGVAGSLGTRTAYNLNMPWAAVEMNLDEAQSRAEFERLLQDLTDLAQKRSVAIASVSATPMSLSLLSAWIGTLDQKGFQLVPVSALAKKQIIR